MSFLKKYLSLAIAAAVGTVLLPFAAQLQQTMAENRESKQQEVKAEAQQIKVLLSDGTVQTMDLEEYIVGVVSAEMPASFETEALKAQAVAARTYALRRRDTGQGLASHDGKADVCTDYTHCKGYISPEDALLNWGENGKKNLKKIRGAVESTAGEVVVYENQVIDAVFHAASSGHTESSKDVWGGDLPYLVSVYSEGDENDPDYLSTVTVKASEFKSKILAEEPKADLSGSPEDWCKGMTKTAGGAVAELSVGGVKMAGTVLRKVFDLRSATFELTFADGAFTFTVHGYGHGVGMSQNGANFLAKQGKKYKDILKWYYKGVDIVDYATVSS